LERPHSIACSVLAGQVGNGKFAIAGINNEQYPDKRLHWEATHQVLCSTESLFLSDFTPTYSGDNSTTQTFDKLCSQYLEYRTWLINRLVERPAVVFNAVG
jgi:hypothetical protein